MEQESFWGSVGFVVVRKLESLLQLRLLLDFRLAEQEMVKLFYSQWK